MLRLHNQLQQSHQVAITAVVGMGGIGKTELALQYAHAYEPSYPGGICWLLARDQDIATQILTFAQTYLDLHPAEDLPLEARIAYCWNNWPPFSPASTTPPLSSPALIVIDDVPDYDTIAPYLPTAPRFTLLLTTRQQHLATNVTPLPIELLDEGAALDLLKQLAGASRIEANLEQAKAICHWLGYLPLALELAGRYLARKPDLSLSELQTRLEAQELAARALAKAEPGMTNTRGVASAFELSWQDLSEEAQELACLLSCFALAPIPWPRVEACLPDTDTEDLEDLRDDELCRFSLLKRVDEGSYQLHQLVREFLRSKGAFLEDTKVLDQQFCQGIVMISKDFPESPNRQLVLEFSSAIPHIAEVTNHFLHVLNESNFVFPFQAIGRFYEGQGFYEQAETWANIFYQKAKARFGSCHLVVATSQDNLAFIYRTQGKYSEAEPLYLQALKIRKQMLVNQHPEIADSLNNLALLYEAKGQYAAAEPWALEALEMRQYLFGDKHPDVADSLNNLGLLYVNQGKNADAESLLTKALAIRKELLGIDSPRVATSLNNLAHCYASQGKLDQAEPLHLQALSLYKQLLGEEHPDVAVSLNNLAYLYVNQEKYTEAEPLFIQALEISKRSFGDEHPNIATSLNNLAYIYDVQDRFSEAEPLYQQALKMRRQLFGENHVDVAISLNNLATLCRLQDRFQEAKELYIQAVEVLQSQLGSEHPLTEQVKGNLNKLPSGGINKN